MLRNAGIPSKVFSGEGERQLWLQRGSFSFIFLLSRGFFHHSVGSDFFHYSVGSGFFHHSVGSGFLVLPHVTIFGLARSVHKYTSYMTVYMVISLPKIPCIHRVYILVVVNPNMCCWEAKTQQPVVHSM